MATLVCNKCDVCGCYELFYFWFNLIFNLIENKVRFYFDKGSQKYYDSPKKAQAEINLDVIFLESLKTTNASSQRFKDLFFKRNFRTNVHWRASKVQLRLAGAFNYFIDLG